MKKDNLSNYFSFRIEPISTNYVTGRFIIYQFYHSQQYLYIIKGSDKDQREKFAFSRCKRTLNIMNCTPTLSSETRGSIVWILFLNFSNCCVIIETWVEVDFFCSDFAFRELKSSLETNNVLKSQKLVWGGIVSFVAQLLLVA